MAKNIPPEMQVWTWEDAIQQSDLPACAKLILLVLAGDLSSLGRYTQMETAELMKRTSLALRTVRKHIQVAVDADFLDAKERRNAHGSVIGMKYWPKFPANATLATGHAKGSHEGDPASAEEPVQQNARRASSTNNGSKSGEQSARGAAQSAPGAGQSAPDAPIQKQPSERSFREDFPEVETTTAPDGAVTEDPIVEEPVSDFKEAVEAEIAPPAQKKPGRQTAKPKLPMAMPQAAARPDGADAGQKAPKSTVSAETPLTVDAAASGPEKPVPWTEHHSTAPIFDDQGGRQEVQAAGPALPADTLEMAHSLICAWPSGPGGRKVMRPEQSRAMVELMLKPFAADGDLARQALEIALTTLANQALDADSVKVKGPRGAIAYLHGCLKRMIPEMKRDAAINAARVNGVVERENAKTQGVVAREECWTGNAETRVQVEGEKFRNLAQGRFDPRERAARIHGAEVTGEHANMLMDKVPGGTRQDLLEVLADLSSDVARRLTFKKNEDDKTNVNIGPVLSAAERNLGRRICYPKFGKPAEICADDVAKVGETLLAGEQIAIPGARFAEFQVQFPLACSDQAAVRRTFAELSGLCRPWRDYGPTMIEAAVAEFGERLAALEIRAKAEAERLAAQSRPLSPEVVEIIARNTEKAAARQRPPVSGKGRAPASEAEAVKS